MASSGPNSCGTGVNDATSGTIAWTNPGNITASDDSRATSMLGIGEDTQLLVATNFGFAIDATATIVGVVVEWEKSCVGQVDDRLLTLWKTGASVGDDKATAGSWPTPTDAYVTYGGIADLWGLSGTLTPAYINASDFGVMISAVEASGLGGLARVDHCRMTVYFTESAATFQRMQMPHIPIRPQEVVAYKRELKSQTRYGDIQVEI